jgi:tripartite ATP-independent transporter DctP family solute receptor
MSLSRRRVVACGMAALGSPALIGRAKAAEFSWKLGHTAPTDNPLHIRLAEAAAKIATESKGRIELDVFPNMQLGGDNDLLSQARSGAIEFCQPTGQLLGSLLPTAAINALGFVFDNYDHVWPAMDGALGKYVRTQVVAKVGLVPMERIWNLGFREITTSTKPIKTAADLKGLKIRTPVAPSLVSMFQILGAAPLALQIPETYSALQTHIADGQENPLTLINSLKFDEVQKYCSMTNHVWDGHWICANAAAWNGLPHDLQEIVSRSLNEGALLNRDDTMKSDISIQSEMERKGLAFNTTDPDSFRSALRAGGFYKEWRSRLGEEPWALLEQYVGKLA